MSVSLITSLIGGWGHRRTWLGEESTVLPVCSVYLLRTSLVCFLTFLFPPDVMKNVFVVSSHTDRKKMNGAEWCAVNCVVVLPDTRRTSASFASASSRWSWSARQSAHSVCTSQGRLGRLFNKDDGLDFWTFGLVIRCSFSPGPQTSST